MTEDEYVGATGATIEWLAAGVSGDRDELRKPWRADRSFEPDPTEDVDRRYERRGEAVERSRDWAVEEDDE